MGRISRAIALLLATAALAAACGGAPETVAVATESPTPTPRVRYTPIPTEAPSPTIAPIVTSKPVPTATPEPRYDQTPVPANEAAELADQLAMVERAIRDPGITGPKLIWMGHLQQLAYGRLADYPDWKDQVLASLPVDVRPVVASSLDAGKQLRNMKGPIPKTLPDWRIVEPAPVEQLLQYYREAEATFGVGWYYLAAIHLIETRMGRIRGLSSAGAQGPMQFIPSTWAAYGQGDVNSDHDSILAAARYLKAAGAPGDMQRAIYAYNHSNFYVAAVIDYAMAMKADQNAFRGYYGWQVYYPTEDGPVLLPVGWKKPE